MRLSFRSVATEPVRVGATTLTLHSRVLSVGLPNGGLAWQFPTGVRVERAGVATWTPIVDVTLIGRLALFGIALLAIWKGHSQ